MLLVSQSRSGMDRLTGAARAPGTRDTTQPGMEPDGSNGMTAMEMRVRPGGASVGSRM